MKIMSYDSISELREFKWTDPLGSICGKCTEMQGNKYTNAILAYDSYFRHLLAIWARYTSEIQEYLICRDTWTKIAPEFTGIRDLSPEEWDLYRIEGTLMRLLQLDYESFVIFAKTLMDKTCTIAGLLLNDRNIPTQSFTDHKKFFVKSQNNPYITNETYGKLIREETDWFDNCLVVSRDKIMVHSGIPWGGVGISAKDGIRVSKTNMLSGADLKDQIYCMMSLKQSYIDIYPELANVSDDLWSLIQFFMTHNIKLKPEDKNLFYQTVHKAGADLPSLRYIAGCMLDFLKKVAVILENYV